jgi:hypothetical protein
MRKIIDISSANGFVHWPVVRETVDAVILKAADGHFTDNSQTANFYDNRERAERYGTKIETVYGWWYPARPDQTIKSMANTLYRLADGLRMELDLELYNAYWVSGDRADIFNHFDALDQLSGVATVAYLGAQMAAWLANPDGTCPAQLLTRPIHWAEYPHRAVLPYGKVFNQWDLSMYSFQAINNLPAKWSIKPWLWQFNPNGVIPGIPGNSVDLDYEINPLVV